MRVIKSGMEETIHTCSKCGCVYAYTEKDIRIGMDLKDDFNYVACPECEAMLILERFPADNFEFFMY